MVPIRRASPVSPPSVTRIVVTATGYQHEIDECQWVRMDLDAQAPIVGAHAVWWVGGALDAAR
ncbi:MAG TPA: hypothetical protein VGI56_00320 [Galbitalea sp.]|jgi:hypothetical protein